MEPSMGKAGFVRNFLVRALLFGVLVVVVRFVYIVTIRGESCDVGNFCFFSPENLNIAGEGKLAASAIVMNDVVGSTSVGNENRELWTSKDWIEAVRFYSAVFQDLIADGHLTTSSKALCVETLGGQDVFALKEIGVADSIGTGKKSSPPLVKTAQPHRQPFGNNTFDFVFAGGGVLDRLARPFDFAAEIARTLKPEGFLVVHTAMKDTYSFNSFLDLFNSCTFVKSRDIVGFDSSMPHLREIVMEKESEISRRFLKREFNGTSMNKCLVPGFKQELIRNAEPLITEEPLKPWLTLKRNIKNIKYIPSMADISFKQRYVYVDVGARGFGSSIGSWFKKQYPKQNKTFEVYAIEADKTFHEQYKSRKGVKLLPYAAWVKNETLFFEINRDPGQKKDDKNHGMGRIKPVQSSGSLVSDDVDKIQGFDFAEWLENTVSERDFVVMKMDVEGTEFDLIPKLFETGTICLIDEIFLECHYNRWQRCCPGERSSKYTKTYDQCLELFTSLRQSGVLVHQWW